MSQTTIQTPAEIAAALGYKHVSLATRRVVADLAPDEIVIGAWQGTAKYMGARVMRRILAQYPAMTRVIVAAIGWQQGEDKFAIVAKKETGV